MKFLVWARKRNTPDALWFDLPYAPRDRNSAEDLIDYYIQEWGTIYEYEIHRVGFTPRGTSVPCIIGHM